LEIPTDPLSALGSGLSVRILANKQTQRWIDAGCFENIVDDLRELLRVAAGKQKQPTAAIYDAQTLRCKAPSKVVKEPVTTVTSARMGVKFTSL
jgi:hypothetical protein